MVNTELQECGAGRKDACNERRQILLGIPPASHPRSHPHCAYMPLDFHRASSCANHQVAPAPTVAFPTSVPQGTSTYDRPATSLA